MDKEVRKKILVAVIIFIGVSLVFILVALFAPKNNPEDLPDPLAEQRAYIDPDSGEEILNPEGKTAEGETNPVLILGFSKLLDAGLSQAQFENTVQVGVQEYIDQQNVASKKITQVSLVVSTISPRIDQASGDKKLISDIRINKKDTLRLEVSYNGIIVATLALYNPSTNETVFVFDPRDEDD